MMKPVAQVMRFMETLDMSALEGVFAAGKVSLMDSFAPYLFEGENATLRWAEGFSRHAAKLANLRHAFGAPREFSRSGETVFFSQPVIWTGASHERSFSEKGGLALMLVRQEGAWRIRNYAWAVVDYAIEGNAS